MYLLAYLFISTPSGYRTDSDVSIGAATGRARQNEAADNIAAAVRLSARITASHHDRATEAAKGAKLHHASLQLGTYDLDFQQTGGLLMRLQDVCNCFPRSVIKVQRFYFRPSR